MRMWARVAAHPRECGADVCRPTRPGSAMGSSPRVRGGHWGVALGHWGIRLIPASAGRTANRAFCYLLPWAHPRECGADG